MCTYRYIMPRTISTPLQLGAAIRDARSQRRMTQEQLATAAGVSRRWLINLEAGRGGGSEFDMVLATIDALGLSLVLSAERAERLTATEQELLGLLGADRSDD